MMDKKKLKKLPIGNLLLKRLAGSLLFIYACLMLFAYAASDHLIFKPHPSSYAKSDDQFWLENANGTAIAAHYYENAQADYIVLFSHGNYGDLGDIDHDMKHLESLGVSIFAYDYQGYGISEGKASVANACQDAEAALNYLVEKRGIPLDRIILHGRSAGGGPTLYLASRYPVAGVILESTFTSAFRVVTRIPIMPFDKFCNINEIRKVQCPVLVIHGAEDRKIPIYHGEALYRIAPGSKMHCWLEHSSHDIMQEEDRRQYDSTIVDCITRISMQQKTQRAENNRLKKLNH